MKIDLPASSTKSTMQKDKVLLINSCFSKRIRMAETLKIENSIDLLLVLLYAPGPNGQECEPIEGITRLQKLIFLLNQGKGPQKLVEIAKMYEYKPYKMGPYTNSLRDDLDTLISIGLVGTERLKYLITDDADDDTDICGFDCGDDTKRIESQKYYLTKNGKEAGKELYGNLTQKEKEDFAKFKSFFCSLTLRQLLIFVYDNFPKFTINSEIKGQLGM